jgi:hypothetical protein
MDYIDGSDQAFYWSSLREKESVRLFSVCVLKTPTPLSADDFNIHSILRDESCLYEPCPAQIKHDKHKHNRKGRPCDFKGNTAMDVDATRVPLLGILEYEKKHCAHHKDEKNDIDAENKPSYVIDSESMLLNGGQECSEQGQFHFTS